MRIGKGRRAKKIWIFLALFFMLYMGVMTRLVVFALGDEVEPPAEPYNSTGSVVQVVFLYTDETGVRHIIQSGSGVLLNETGVLTTRYTVTLSDESKQRAGEYLSAILGRNITFYQPPEEEKDQWEVATAQLAVVAEADIYSMAEIRFESVDWDVAFLELSDVIQKEHAVLGDSGIVKIGDSLRTQGYPNMDWNAPSSFASSEVLTYEGVCAELLDGSIRHTCDFRMGCVGGPIIDRYGRIVAIITYVPGESNVYSALPINQIKDYLDSNGFAYRSDVNDYSKPQTTETTEAPPTVYKNELFDAISEAEYIITNESEGVYTEESYRSFELAYDKAVKIYKAENALQKDVDDREAELRDAIAKLVHIQKKNNTKLIIIIAVSVVAAVLFVLLVVLIIKKVRRQKAEKEEAKRIKTIEGSHGIQGASSDESLRLRNVGLPSAQLYAQFDAKQRLENKQSDADLGAKSVVHMEPGIKVLPDEEGTTVLNSFVQAPINAFLYRSSTGESVAVTNDSFCIGKNTEGVDYRVDGNTNISRFHAVITRSNETYYIEDLGSTNYTFVNSVKIAPNRKQQIQSNDVIFMADEEFIFMIEG